MSKTAEPVELKGESADSGPVVRTTRRITTELETEIKKNLTQLKEELKDNPKFATTLVEQSLLIGKEIDSGDITNLVFKEYPDELISAHRNNLFDTLYYLGTLIFGDHALTRKEMVKHAKEDEEYGDKLREEIEETVKSVFFSDKKEDEKAEDVIIGDIDQSSIE